jgi:hypothetical protein
MNEKVFFVRSRHNRLLLPFLFVFVSLFQHCGLEDFGSLWPAATAGVQTFQKKEKTCASFW